jgi:hypothetical protein
MSFVVYESLRTTPPPLSNYWAPTELVEHSRQLAGDVVRIAMLNVASLHHVKNLSVL